MKKQQKKEKLSFKKFQIARLSNPKKIVGGSVIIISTDCGGVPTGGNDTATEG